MMIYIYSIIFYFLMIVGVNIIGRKEIQANLNYITDNQLDDDLKKFDFGDLISTLIVSLIPVIRLLLLVFYIIFVLGDENNDIIFQARWVVRNTHTGDFLFKKNKKEKTNDIENKDEIEEKDKMEEQNESDEK